MFRASRVARSAVLLFAVACGDAGGGDSGATQTSNITVMSSPTGDTPTTTTPGTASVSGTGTTAQGSEGDSTAAESGGSSGAMKFDLPSVQDIGSVGCRVGDPECGCSAVDVLFIVDNSLSMQEHAPGVIAAFEPFVDEMIGVLPAGTSLHVGVTRATGFYDPGNGGGWGGPTCEAVIIDGAWYPPTSGDNGTNGQQGRLYEQDGLRYYDLETDGGDTQGLKSWFKAALAGAIDQSAPHSNTETVVAGAAYPFHPVNAGWNAGFMREQAVLVLFLMSDSPDLAPIEVPTGEFIDIVSAAKSGCGDMCIITTGAIAADCYDQPGNTNTRLFDFMNGFGQPPPSWTSLKAGEVADFDGVLGAALTDLIGATCMAIPPG